MLNCHRCQLPLIGGAYSVEIGSGARSQSFRICEPCLQSLSRWMARPRRAPRDGDRSRTPVLGDDDARPARRRSRAADSLDRFEARSRRALLVSVAGSVVAVAAFITLVVLMLKLAGDAGPNRK